MAEETTWKQLPKTQKKAEELQKYFSMTPEREKQLFILIAQELRNFGMEQIIWARNEEASGLGLFEYADPFEEADRIIWKLRAFGFLPESEPAQAKEEE